MRILLALYLVLISACAYPPLGKEEKQSVVNYSYQIGPGDVLEIFVWNNTDISSTVSVRPDGKITTPLAEDIFVNGKTPKQVARELEKSYEAFIRHPKVVVMVSEFQGVDSQQIRIVGQLGNEGGGSGGESSRYRGMTIPYEIGMTLLDVIIKIGSIGEFADGNRASIIRVIDGTHKKFGVKIDTLIEDADLSENIDMHPGDILIIPEALF